MFDRVVATDRLILRPYKADDATPIFHGISDWDVIKWLTSPPYPYALQDAVDYLGRDNHETRAIEMNGDLIGSVGLHDLHDEGAIELGYWLAKPFWGQGLMTEAASAAVADHFDHTEQTLISGYLLGSTASCNVLTKLGFQNTHVIQRMCRPQGREMPLQRMALRRADWRAHIANSPTAT